MGSRDDVKVTITPDCGHEFAVGVAGLEIDGLEYCCPVCGRTGTFDAEDAVAIEQNFQRIAKAGRAAFRDATKRFPKS